MNAIWSMEIRRAMFGAKRGKGWGFQWWTSGTAKLSMGLWIWSVRTSTSSSSIGRTWKTPSASCAGFWKKNTRRLNASSSYGTGQVSTPGNWSEISWTSLTKVWKRANGKSTACYLHPMRQTKTQPKIAGSKQKTMSESTSPKITPSLKQSNASKTLSMNLILTSIN